MRPLTSDIMERILQMHQTQANNADPRIRALVQRANSIIDRSSMLTSEVVVKAPAGLAITSADTAVSAPHWESGPDYVYVVYALDGEAVLVRRAYTADTGSSWDMLGTFGSGAEVSIEFDADMATTPDGMRFETTGDPFLFRVHGGALLVRRGLTGEDYTLDTGVTGNISTVRGWKHQTVIADDQGIIVAYVKDGIGWYRTWARQSGGNYEWEIARQIPNMPGGLVYLTVFVTEDYRVVFLGQTSTSIHMCVTERAWSSMDILPEHIAAVGNIDMQLYPVTHINTDYDSEHIAAEGTLDIGLLWIEPIDVDYDDEHIAMSGTLDAHLHAVTHIDVDYDDEHIAMSGTLSITLIPVDQT